MLLRARSYAESRMWIWVGSVRCLGNKKANTMNGWIGLVERRLFIPCLLAVCRRTCLPLSNSLLCAHERTHALGENRFFVRSEFI